MLHAKEIPEAVTLKFRSISKSLQNHIIADFAKSCRYTQAEQPVSAAIQQEMPVLASTQHQLALSSCWQNVSRLTPHA